jgi:hypothetical protein
MIVWEQMCLPREVVLILLVVNKYSQTHGWVSPKSRAQWNELIHRSRSAAAVMASSFTGERISRGRLAFVSAVSVNTACLIEPLLQSSEHFVVSVTSNKIMYCELTCLRTSSNFRDTKGEEHAAAFVVRAFLDHSITTESYGALWWPEYTSQRALSSWQHCWALC